MRKVSGIASTRSVTLLIVCAIAASTSGCAYTMGEFDRTADARPASIDAGQTSALPMKPATYVVDTTNAASTSQSADAAPPLPGNTAAHGYPNFNQVPEGPKSKLLTPEQKAKVIADLEALAKSQEAAVEQTRKQSASKCDEAVRNALNPEAKLKSEAAGQGC